jgi:long-chain acyl-CoA synthetase
MTGITHAGVSVGFYGGDVAALLDDVAELRPTIFCSVPRLWNRVHDRILAQVAASSPLARRRFAAALAHKKRALVAGDAAAGGGGAVGAFWDRLVFSKIRAKLGGRVRLMTSGASPIAGDVIDFMRAVFGATVVEGYGMTETACTISLKILLFLALHSHPPL